MTKVCSGFIQSASKPMMTKSFSIAASSSGKSRKVQIHQKGLNMMAHLFPPQSGFK